METLQRYCTRFFINIVRPYFVMSTAAVLLGMDPYKLWTVCSGVLYHFSWRISSCCFRDIRGGNLFLTLISKCDRIDSMTLKSGNCAGQGRCWSSPSCSSNHVWTVPAVWMGALSYWKTPSLFENRGMHLITQPVRVLPFINNGTNRILYHDDAPQTTRAPRPCFTVGTRHSGL
jgi:hypothetical protein